MGVEGFGFRVWCLFPHRGAEIVQQFRVCGLRCAIQGLQFRVCDSGFAVQGVRFMVWDSRCAIQGLGFRIQGFNLVKPVFPSESGKLIRKHLNITIKTELCGDCGMQNMKRKAGF